MPTATVQVEGVSRLRSTLRRAGVDLSDFTAVNRAAAEIVRAAAQPRTPRGPDVGGHVATTVRVGATKTAGIIRAGNNSSYPYAGVIHWGWPAHNIRPNPWVSQAAQDTEPQWVPEYFERLEQVVKTVEGA